MFFKIIVQQSGLSLETLSESCPFPAFTSP